MLWTVLLLWSELFNLIGVGLFEEPLFVLPVTGAALGYGIAAGREAEATLARLRGLVQALLQALTPIVAFVTLLFIATTLFTGLEPLFATGSAAAILIAWSAAFVLLLNAVYLDGSAPPPYGALLRRAVEAGILALPALPAIGLYALGLRTGQHGLTPDRMYGLVLAGVLGLYALGYAAAAVLRGPPWLPYIRGVNRAMALVLIALALLLHTPVLDPIAWSVRHQVARLRSARVGPDQLDFGYLRFHLGRRGYAALITLRDDPPPEAAAATREKIAAALAVERYRDWQHGVGPAFDRDRKFERIAAAGEWPPGLTDALREATEEESRLQQCGHRATCVAFALDLDGDAQPEELIASRSSTWFEVTAFGRGEDGTWRLLGTLRQEKRHLAKSQTEAWLSAVRTRRYRDVPPRYRDLMIGSQRFRLLESE